MGPIMRQDNDPKQTAGQNKQQLKEAAVNTWKSISLQFQYFWELDYKFNQDSNNRKPQHTGDTFGIVTGKMFICRLSEQN